MARHPSAHRRLSITLLLALALHLAGLAGVVALRLLSPSPRRLTEARPRPTEVQLIHLPPPAPQARPPDIAPHAPPRDKEPHARQERPLRRKRRRRPSPPAPTIAKEEPVPAPRLSLRMRPLDLSPSATLFDDELADIRARRAGPGRRREDEGEGEAARVARRVRRWLRRDAGVRNVRLGRAHPALYTLLRRVERRFAPNASMLQRRLRHAGREALRAYRAGIDAFNRMGTALPLDRWETGDRSALAVLPDTVKTMAGRQIVDRAAAKNSRRLVSEICVEAAPGGHARLIARRRFGVPGLDAHAIDAVRRAVAAAPMPRDLPPGRACYRLVVRFGRTLPTPSLGCSFDASFKDWSCSWPTKSTFAHTVRLVAVWPED